MSLAAVAEAKMVNKEVVFNGYLKIADEGALVGSYRDGAGLHEIGFGHTKMTIIKQTFTIPGVKECSKKISLVEFNSGSSFERTSKEYDLNFASKVSANIFKVVDGAGEVSGKLHHAMQHTKASTSTTYRSEVKEVSWKFGGEGTTITMIHYTIMFEIGYHHHLNGNGQPPIGRSAVIDYWVNPLFA